MDESTANEVAKKKQGGGHAGSVLLSIYLQQRSVTISYPGMYGVTDSCAIEPNGKVAVGGIRKIKHYKLSF